MFNTGLELMTPPASVYVCPFPSPSLLPPEEIPLTLLRRHGSRPGTTTSSGLSTPLPTPISNPTYENPTHPVRLTLGTYELDDRDSHLLQTSLLKIELGKISACVEAFEARLAGTKMHRDLVAYLRQGLGGCYEGVKQLGRGVGM